MRDGQHLRVFQTVFGKVKCEFWIACGCMHTMTFVLYSSHYVSDKGAIDI